MEIVLLPVLIIGGMGLVFGALLAVAAKVFEVKKDERIPKITEILPGANCGGCGFAGCAAYAAAIVENGAAVNCCSVGGNSVAAEIAGVMGVSAEKCEKQVAYVRCSGTNTAATLKYRAEDDIDCHTANRLGGGIKDCAYGCLGFGSCVKKCSFGAIRIIDGVAVVDREKCGGCGACIAECPRHIIVMIPYERKNAVVACNSAANGKTVRAVCSAGCIGCGICAKNCPSGAITVESSLASVDAEKCTGCGLCAEKCPRKIIKLVTAGENAAAEQKNNITAGEPQIAVALKAEKR